MIRFFSQVYLSATDFSFYRKIVRQKLSSTLQYFGLFVLCLSLIASVFSYFFFKNALEIFSAWAQKNLPEMVIKNGVLTSPVTQPYTVKEKNFVFTLDTTGKVTRLDPLNKQEVLLLKDRMLVKRIGGENMEILFDWVKNFRLTAEMIQKWKQKAIPLLLPILFSVFLIGMILSKTIQTLLFSVSVWVFSNPKSTGLNLKDLFNLSVYAVTPASLIALAVQSLRLEIPYFPFLYFAMYAAFFIGAFLQCKITRDKEKDMFYEL